MALETVIKSMDNMDLHRINGVNYVVYMTTPDIDEHFEFMRQVDIRQDDVITVGFPRSGNHWTYELVHMIVNQTVNFAEATYYEAFIDSLDKDINATLNERLSPRILPSHNRIFRIPSQAVDKKVKIIYIARNPKDTLASLYRLMANLKIDSGVFKGTWEDFFLLQMSGDFPWGSWFDHVLATEKFMNDHPDCPVYILVYEDLKKDPVSKIRELCSFLEKPTTLAEEIAEKTEFGVMKKELLKGKMKGETDALFGNDNIVFRTGIVGDWKNWFTVAQNEVFNKKFDEKLGDSKFGDLFRQYL